MEDPVRHEQNGEPSFTTSSPTIFVSNLGSAVKVGTYISFFYESRLQYGRIIKAFVSSNGGVCVTVDKYLMQSDLKVFLVSKELLPSPLVNRFISVQELYRSSVHFYDIPTNHLHGLIFVFNAEAISREGYEGSKRVFCLRYEVSTMNIITPIQNECFLPFHANTEWLSHVHIQATA